MSTKEQESKALEKIKKIVADLGEDSYVGTALAGCFDIAEQNIECDAAFSLKEELEIARKELKEKDACIEQLSSDCSTLRSKFNKAEQHLVSANSLDVAMEAIRKVKGDYLEEVIKLKNTIVDNAETPDTEVFKNAVKRHKFLVKECEFYSTALSEIDDKVLRQK